VTQPCCCDLTSSATSTDWPPKSSAPPGCRNRIDLPGIDIDTLEVTEENNTLTVRAERRAAVPQDAVCPVGERPTGAYARRLVVGDGLNVDAITADYHNGGLTLTRPVVEPAKPRGIDVGHSEAGDTGLPGAAQKTISGQTTEGDEPAVATTS
jgi:HSP20 family protein